MAGMTERERRIREDRANVWNGMTAIMEKMDKGEALTSEDRTAMEQGNTRLSELEKDLGIVVQYQNSEREKEEDASKRGISRDEREGEADQYSKAFTQWLKRGMNGVNQEQRTSLDANALQTAGAGVTTAGGFLIPQGFWHNLQIALKAYGGLLSLCNVMPTATGNPMPWPTNDPTSIVGSYITEGNQVGFQDYVFGQGMLFAWTLTSNVILASVQIIEDSAFDVDQFVTDRAGEAIGRLIAQELHTGAGSASKALTGIHTANAALGTPRIYQANPGGVAAGDNVFTLSNPSTSAPAAVKGLVSFASIAGMVRSIDPAYRAGAHRSSVDQGAGKAPAGGCNWVMNDTTLTNLRTITDGFGHPLWQPNPQQGEADMLWGFPYLIDQNMPSVAVNTIDTVGGLWFGDFKRAMIVRQVDGGGTMRLTERYADFLQVGYLVHVRMDAQPNDMRAVVEYKSAHVLT